MFTPTNPIVKPLDNTLFLKSVSTEDDIERLAAFNKTIHGGDTDGMTRNLIVHHPDTRPEHWLFVEDSSNGQVVSSLCLIPWTWNFQGITLKAGEMGIVGTLENYRRRGLIRALDTRFKELLREGEFDLSHIQGIPYYYRQFGYEYSLPLEGGWEIGLHQIPDAPAGDAPHFTYRRATIDDIPALIRLYDEAARDLDIFAPRGAGIWRYLLNYTDNTGMDLELWLILDSEGQPDGYVAIQKYGFGTGLNVSEASQLSHTAVVEVLRWLKTLAQERQKPYIRLFPPEGNPILLYAQAWGARNTGRYAWQIHFPDVARLLRTLAPVFEQRIAASSFAGLTKNVEINLYREAFELRFEQGKISALESVGVRPWENGFSIPPNVFVPLALGYRSREELRNQYPDLSIWGQNQVLADVLFPRLEAHIYTMY